MFPAMVNSLILGSVIILSLSADISLAMAVSDCAVFGCGVLGTSLCKQLVESKEFSSWKGEH